MLVARGIAIFSAFFAVGVHAQPYPQKAVRIIVPYVAGGDTDIGARIIAPKLAEALGQQFIVENRPGAGSLIGTEAMLRAPAGPGENPRLYQRPLHGVLQPAAV